jgi:hypothetical protein
MVGGSLARAWAFRVGLGVSDWIVWSSIVFVDFFLVDLIFISGYF